MPRPPKATPHSDIDGVHQDEARSTDVAAELGDDAGDLKRAAEQATARPPYADDQENHDDRT